MPPLGQTAKTLGISAGHQSGFPWDAIIRQCFPPPLQRTESKSGYSTAAFNRSTNDGAISLTIWISPSHSIAS